ncbi:MAG: hypothetical protein LBL91_03880 [Lachnospiraceae bacterium]|nr:hypothetical protein [Lachnospiraceae bacterium]
MTIKTMDNIATDTMIILIILVSFSFSKKEKPFLIRLVFRILYSIRM